MTPHEILNGLSSLGVCTGIRGDNLVLTPKSKIPPFLVGELRRHKAEVMALVLGEQARRAKLRGSPSVGDTQSLLGRDVAVGFYKQGKGQPKIPLNGRGTTVLEASGLCSPSCAHEFVSCDSEAPL